MRLVVLVADGMGDWPVEELGGKTPLAAAETPVMDRLAARGTLGLCRTVPKGMPPGSDVANMALLGFDPSVHHTGRGPIEAAAQGIEAGPDDLIWRMNLVRADNFGPDGIMRDYAGGHISTAEAAPLVRRLAEAAEGLGLEPVPGVQYRHLLVQRGGASTPAANVDARPPHDITDQPIGPDLEEWAKAPEMLRFVERANEIMRGAGVAANAVWPWGQGRPLALPPFAEAFGLRGAVISAVDLVRGLGRACSMEVLEVPGATGLLDTNYQGKVDAALDFLNRGGEFVYLHVEAPDECGHSGVAEDKREAVRRFDKRIVAPLMESLDDTAFLVTCDHLTPLTLRTHHPDPVPFLLWSPGLEGPGAEAFTEDAAAASGLLVEPGHDMLGWALRRLGGRS
ncbi:2,3-bisphosphoglycerate-independent phosphoglycerate mutase [Desulfohalovibrio reitneri]|uniref:2,3-bisphosphoglycerate-independent phosphoglycerate mutase n=1 Tax=Desulfohalovibrio reitneri TaxID=1307759 RepID=UPI0004A6ADB6|nr:2,3-bisphosphoglycerate-independent phosphoglycerate mutase [Desulfohalovibrio reitneri]